MSDLDRVCVAKAREAGQGHLFDRWEDLSYEDQQSLLSQVEHIDFQLFRRLVQQHIHTVAGPLERRALKPAPVARCLGPEEGGEDYEFCRSLAEYALRNGEVLFVTAAGGARQAGFPEPVGMQPVGPVTGKTVFQLLAEKLAALNKRFRNSIRWSIFCHPADIEAIAGFFKAKGYFGLKSSAVSFVAQSLLPVVDRRGAILFSAPGRIAMSPSGHGSLLLHFLHEERLEWLEGQGVRHLFYHQVDNPLIRLDDLGFLGAHIRDQSEVSSKAVRKAAPEESVGVFCQYKDAIGVVEYVELGQEDGEARLEDGTLAFSAANIGVHLFTVEFLRRMHEEGLQLPFHAVDRITPCLSRRGSQAQPKAPNSLGFKSFVFDAIPFARRALVVEVRREDEFSPIKNPSGPFSPETAKSALSALFARWLTAARPELSPAIGDGSTRAVEISPLYAMDPEELRKKQIPEIPAEGPILLGAGS